VALICRDVEETIRLYQDFLGFPLVELSRTVTSLIEVPLQFRPVGVWAS
jgi:catechol 2,3-dioxygenase-like lactoylglutathione lyase family enzyme